MKKAPTLILALILLLALPGCGLLGKIISKAESKVSEMNEYSELEESSEPDYNSKTVSGFDSTDTIYGQMTAAERAAFIQQAALSGAQVTFNADGSTTFVYENGTVTKQNADGTWTYSDEDGTATTQFGGQWPDNEFTRQVPKPDFEELFGATTDGNTFTVLFTDTDNSKMRTYIETVKAEGFTIDASTTDETALGFPVLSYTAKNTAGYEITVSSAMGVNTIIITKK